MTIHIWLKHIMGVGNTLLAQRIELRKKSMHLELHENENLMTSITIENSRDIKIRNTFNNISHNKYFAN